MDKKKFYNDCRKGLYRNGKKKSKSLRKIFKILFNLTFKLKITFFVPKKPYQKKKNKNVSVYIKKKRDLS